jgi:cold shock CspA family protein
MSSLSDVSDANMGTFMKGFTRWYRKNLEYGFIIADGIKKDIFFHRKDISPSTKEHELCGGGVAVEFQFKHGDEGPRALDVNVIRSEGEAS